MTHYWRESERAREVYWEELTRLSTSLIGLGNSRFHRFGSQCQTVCISQESCWSPWWKGLEMPLFHFTGENEEHRKKMEEIIQEERQEVKKKSLAKTKSLARGGMWLTGKQGGGPWSKFLPTGPYSHFLRKEAIAPRLHNDERPLIGTFFLMLWSGLEKEKTDFISDTCTFMPWMKCEVAICGTNKKFYVGGQSLG